MKKIITFSILTYLLFTINSSAIDNKSNDLENKNLLKIGVLVPLSGEFRNIGESFLKAIHLALKDISNSNIKIYPNSHYVTPRPTIQQAIKQIKKELKNTLTKNRIVPNLKAVFHNPHR